MPVDVSDLLLTPEKAPAIVRSGGRGGAPIEWEKIIGPTISTMLDQDILIQVFPKEGLPSDDEEKEQAKRQASARAASIANRYWNHVPNECVETSVRMRPEGNFGVYATYRGLMTEELRIKMGKRRQPRGPRDSAQASPSAAETPPVTPGTGQSATAPAAPATSAAERVKAAAKTQARR